MPRFAVIEGFAEWMLHTSESTTPPAERAADRQVSRSEVFFASLGIPTV